MRRSVVLAVLLALAAPARAQQGPPHAFLFGSWTGGIFPVGSHVTAEACLGHPTVIFTQDLVLRASLTEFAFAQRQVGTVRVAGQDIEFRFIPAPPPATEGLLGVIAPPGVAGFGCESPDTLHVERRGENEISFPGCADFPDPLVRCPSR